MKKTSLCYIEKDKKFLMLFRNKKENDPNEGKWIGIGGKFEGNESPTECACREVLEETGLTLTSCKHVGLVHFVSDTYENEDMYLFRSNAFWGDLVEDCDEGKLEWVPIEDLPSLPMWEGDKYFIEALLKNEGFFEMTLTYTGDKLISVL